MNSLVVECKPDEALVKCLGYPRRIVTHQPNKGEVINYLSRNADSVGIVDEDPGSANPSYQSKFIVENKDHLGLVSYIIPKENKRLIVIKPRLEEWVLMHANNLKIDIGKYSLPNDGLKLHKMINTKIPQFEKLLTKMLQENCPALKHLKFLIGKVS